MNERNIGQEILDGLREIKAHKAGTIELKTHQFDEQSSTPQTVRTRLNLSQAAFANLLGVSVPTVQDWEQGRQQPQGAARVLLQVAAKYPDAVWDVVHRELEVSQPVS